MNINLNTSHNNYQKPSFTANLKGPAIHRAIKDAKDISQLFEVAEIIENVKNFGDPKTIINCALDGVITVSNDKFSRILYKFELNKNEKSENPFLDMIKTFNTENKVIKLETDLFDTIFSLTRGLSTKIAKYKLLSSYDLPVTTEGALRCAARKNGIFPNQTKDYSNKAIAEELNNFKSKVLAMYQQNLR